MWLSRFFLLGSNVGSSISEGSLLLKSNKIKFRAEFRDFTSLKIGWHLALWTFGNNGYHFFSVQYVLGLTWVVLFNPPHNLWGRYCFRSLQDGSSMVPSHIQLGAASADQQNVPEVMDVTPKSRHKVTAISILVSWIACFG